MSESENYYAIQAGKDLVKAEERLVYSENGTVHSWDQERREFKRVGGMEDGVLPLDQVSINAGSVESFLKILEANATEGQSAVLFSADRQVFRGVLDFYGPSGHLGYQRKSVKYEPNFSKAFKSWYKGAGDIMSQDEFSEFLDEQLEHILEPSGSQLLDICSTLSVTSSSFFSRTKRLQDGSVELEYKENQEAKGGAKNLQLPREFKVAVPLFKPSISDTEPELVELTAKLFYRLSNGKIVFWFRLVGVEQSILNVVSDLYRTIENGLPEGVPMYEQD